MSENRKRTTVRIAVIAVIALLALAGGGIALSSLLGSGGGERSNMLSLARNYMAKGDYDRALDILDRLLIKDATDAEALALQDEALAGKQKAEDDRLARENAGQQKIASTLDTLGQNISKTPQVTVIQQPAQVPQEDPAAKKKAAEAEAARQKAAEADAEAARKRAQDEELAKKSKDLQDKMKAVNALVERGRKEIDGGEIPKGRKTFGEAVSKIPDGEDTFASQKLADIADSYYGAYKKSPDSADGQQSIKDAIETSRDALKKDISNPSPHYTLGKINNDLRQYDNAVTELKEAARLDPKNYLYAYELGKSYYNQKKYEEASQAFTACVTLNAKFEPGFFNLAMAEKMTGDQTASLKAFRKAIELKPDYSRAYQEMGRIHSQKGDTANAIAAYSKAVQIEPGNVQYLRDLGLAYLDSGVLKEAETWFQKALAIKEDDITSYNMAMVKIRLGKGSDAVKYAERAVALKAGSAIYQYTLGLACELVKNEDGAIAAYTEAASLDKKYVLPRINMGKIFLEGGFVDKALVFLDEAYKLDPAGVEVNNNLGNAYAKKGLNDKAVFHYEKALASSPRDVTAKLNLARAYVSMSSFVKAKDAYLDVIRMAPDSWDAYFEIGKTCLSLDDQATARKYLTELLAKKPDFSKRAEAEKILSGL